MAISEIEISKLLMNHTESEDLVRVLKETVRLTKLDGNGLAIKDNNDYWCYDKKYEMVAEKLYRYEELDKYNQLVILPFGIGEKILSYDDENNSDCVTENIFTLEFYGLHKQEFDNGKYFREGERLRKK